jgi:hypothetical protein
VTRTAIFSPLLFSFAERNTAALQQTLPPGGAAGFNAEHGKHGVQAIDKILQTALFAVMERG